jgi:secreted trypsin-like serine protease
VLRFCAAIAALGLLLTSTGPAAARDEPRIVGGSSVSASAYATQWPWLVVVTVRLSPFREAECTGSVIAPQWVLTAAHCTLSDGWMPRAYSADKFTVSGGSPDASRAGTLGTVDAVHTDPDYDAAGDVSAVGDVALLHLAAPVTGIRLPYLAAASPTGPTVATALGWGRTSGSSSVSPTLRAVQVTVGPRGAGTLYNAGPNGTCNGDSGGPLAVGRIIIGTTSWGDDACTTDNYYTDTASVTQWILATTRAVSGSTPPSVAAAPQLATRDVSVRTNKSSVALTIPQPTVSDGTVTCNRPARPTVAVPSRMVITCTATSDGGSASASYVLTTRRVRTAVTVRKDGHPVTSLRRGARVAIHATGFPASALVTVTWGARHTTVRATSTGLVQVHLAAPRSPGASSLTLRATGAQEQIRVQSLQITR